MPSLCLSQQRMLCMSFWYSTCSLHGALSFTPQWSSTTVVPAIECRFACACMHAMTWWRHGEPVQEAPDPCNLLCYTLVNKLIE